MKRKTNVSTLMLTAITMVSLSACVSVQPAGEAVPTSLQDARELTIQGQPDDRSPTVRWGGTIVKVVNDEQGSTLEVVARPLDRAGRPLRNDRSEGRFLADHAGFLDPEIYTPGRDITVLGPLAGTRQGLIGETRYSYPVVRVESLRYWQPRVPPPLNAAYPPGVYSYHDWWWHRFYHDWPHVPPPPRSFIRGEVLF